MTEPIEDRLRGALATARLPAAPASLRARLNSLASEPTSPIGRRALRLNLVGVGAVVLLLAAFLTVYLLGAAPTNPMPTPSAPPFLPTGLAHLDRHGISFDYPVGWRDEVAVVRPNYGTDFVAFLVDGIPDCNPPSYVPDGPLVAPCLDEAGTMLGSARVVVTEFINPGPDFELQGDPVVVDGHRGVVSSSLSPGRTWVVWGEGGNVYLISALVPPADTVRSGQVDALIASIRLSVGHEPSPPIVNGRVALDTGQGVTFSYPEGWLLYYPQTMSMMDGPLVLVASKALEPCTTSDCQFYVVPSGAIAVEFRAGGGLGQRDWTKATEMIGGQPAFRHDWTQPNAHSTTEGHSWDVRFGSGTLGIYASLGDPNLAELRPELDELLRSVEIDPTARP